MSENFPGKPIKEEEPRKIIGLRDVPTHVWLLICCLVLLTAYYIRPDPIVQNLVISFFGALLLSLRTGSDQRPPPSK